MPRSPTTARLASLADIFLFHPILRLFPLRTAEPGSRLMLVSNLACETKVEKGVCLRRLAKFSLHSKRFQSSYCAKVLAKANLKWNGEGEGRRGNACPRTQ